MTSRSHGANPVNATQVVDSSLVCTGAVGTATILRVVPERQEKQLFIHYAFFRGL